MKSLRSVYENVLAEGKHLLEACDSWGLQKGRWSAGRMQVDLDCFAIDLRSMLRTLIIFVFHTDIKSPHC